MGDGWNFLGKNLIFLGLLLIIIGLLFLFRTKLPFLGHLPGDIVVKKKNFEFYFPIVTCLLLSIIISIIIAIIFSLWKR